MEEIDSLDALRAEIGALRAKNAELARALAAAEERVDRFRQILEAVPGVIWEIEGVPDTPSARTVYVNERVEQILGYSREEWLASHALWSAILHPEDVSKFANISREHFSGRGPEHRLITKDGRVVWMEPHITILRDASGALVGAGIVSLDVTERVQAGQVRAELLERSKGLKERVDNLIASVPGVVWEARGRAGSPEHRVTFVSEHVTLMLGYPAGEMLNDNVLWQRIFYPEDKERAAREIAAIYEKGSGSAQYRWVTRDGRVIWVESTFHVIRDAAGEPAGAYGVSIDITARKVAEEERARLQEEVIRAQAAALEELSTPLIPLSAEVLVMPLVGAVDEARAARVIEALLQGINRARARFAIIDITGVSSVDARTADALLRAARAVRLLGAEVVLSGIRAEVAQTLVALGTAIQGIVTCGNLESGIAYATRRR